MSTYLERERAERLEHLELAEKALRAVLHGHVMDPSLRAHAERAIAHVRESRIVITDPGHARSVEALGRQLDRVSRFLSNAAMTSASHRA